MIWDFTELIKELKICRINPGFHFMEDKLSIALKIAMETMDINYLLFPPSNHRENNLERAIQAFKNHFIAGLCSVDKDFQLQLWYI